MRLPGISNIQKTNYFVFSLNYSFFCISLKKFLNTNFQKLIIFEKNCSYVYSLILYRSMGQKRCVREGVGSLCIDSQTRNPVSTPVSEERKQERERERKRDDFRKHEG